MSASALTDARQLVPHVQQMIDAALPIAAAIEAEGDFTVTLYVRRRDGEVDADANLQLRRGRRK